MKKLFIVAQWIVVIGVALVLIQGLRRRAAPVLEPNRGEWNQWDGFHAIAFNGVSRREDPDLISRDRLRALLAALSKEGYTTITLADAGAFLRGEHPLPDRAVLILFEGGRKDSFLWPTPLLRSLNMRAVLAVPTGVLKKWGSFFVRKSDLRYAAQSPLWELAAMGDRAVWSIPVDERGGTGAFLSQKMWRQGAPESDVDYGARVEKDFADCAKVIADATPRTWPMLYVHPFSDDGRNPDAYPLAAGTIRNALERHFTLAFTGARHSFNGPQSDPLALSRLSVAGTCGASELIEALKRAEPRKTAAVGFAPDHAWLIVGDALRTDDALKLTPSAQAWLRGSSDWTNVEAEMSVRPAENGWTSLCLRHSARGPSVRVAVRRGWIQVQETVGPRMQTLLREPLPSAAEDAVFRVQARVKGRRVWIAVNGGSWSHPLPITPATRSGMVGLTSEGASSVVTGFRAQPIPSLYVMGVDLSGLPSAEREDVAAIMPRWWTSGEPPDLSKDRQDEILQAMALGMETIPIIHATRLLNEGDAEAWVAALTRLTRTVPVPMPVSQVLIEGDSGALAAVLKKQGWMVLRPLSCEEAAAREPPHPDQMEGYVILGPADASEKVARRWLTHIPPDRMAVEGWPVDGRPAAIHPVRVRISKSP